MAVLRWWVVANPKLWKWERLFETGKIEFRRGRLEKNFAQLKVGDTVVGYQSSPSNRLAALASVSKVFSNQDNPAFELVPLLQLPSGLTYAELLSDPALAASQPMRNLNRGILFALTDAESNHLLDLLAHADRAVKRWMEQQDGPHDRER